MVSASGLHNTKGCKSSRRTHPTSHSFHLSQIRQIFLLLCFWSTKSYSWQKKKTEENMLIQIIVCLLFIKKKKLKTKQATKETLGRLTNSKHAQRGMHQIKSPTACINSRYFRCSNSIGCDGEARTAITLRSQTKFKKKKKMKLCPST